MLYREFGRLGWQVSAIGMGTWNIGNQWGEVDEATAWATVRAAYDAGMNLFDTAESYGIPNGLSEMRLGPALAGIRHNVYLVSKIGNWGKRTGQAVPKTTPDMIRLCGYSSLGRLRTDWLDVVLCHEANIEDPSVYLEGFETLKDEGVIRAYGISTNDLSVLKRFNAEGTCHVVEIDYSLLNLKPESTVLPYCQEQGIAVLVRGPLRRGLLSGKYTAESAFTDAVRSTWNPGTEQRAAYEAEVARVDALRAQYEAGVEMVTAALRYVISHPCAPVAIPGCKSPEQAKTNAQTGSVVFDPSERAALRALMA